MDIFLDRRTHDITPGDYDLPTVTGIDLIRQRIKQRLLTIQGEWFLDTQIGIPWFDEVFRKRPNRDVVEGLIVTTIQETGGVEEVSDFELEFYGPQRRLSVRFTAQTAEGALDMGMTL